MVVGGGCAEGLARFEGRAGEVGGGGVFWAGGGVDVAEEEGTAFAGEEEGCCAADSGTGAGDYGDFGG